MNKNSHNELKAGTGFMLSLADAIRYLEEKGYIENLVSHANYFSCRSDQIYITPEEIVVDKIVRFENTSDPDDQAILYAISAPDKGIKGIYVESYGIYNEPLSKKLLDVLSDRASRRVS